MKTRDYAAASLLIALVATGCGASSPTHATLKVAGGAAGRAQAAPAKAGKQVVAGSPDLRLAVSPSSGAPGTVVHLTATGCIDATGQDHAVSFNATGTSAGRNPKAVRSIESTLSGTTLAASYTVRHADRGARHGTFYVQCGSTVVSAQFRVTR